MAISSFTENFDGVVVPALPAGWTTSNSGAGGANWVTSAASPDTAPNSAFVPDNSDVGDNVLDTPVIAVVRPQAQLTFRHQFNFEGSNFDGGVLEIKIGAGAFTDILAAGGSFAAGGYNGTISTGFSNPLGGRSAWVGDSGYITTTVNLPASAAGQNVQFRWREGTDSSIGDTGWFVDTVSLAGVLPPGGNVVIDANDDPAPGNQANDGVADSFLVVYTASALTVSVNGTPVFVSPLAAVNSLTINGSFDVDNVSIDGNDVTTDIPVTLNGGAGADTLDIDDLDIQGAPAFGLSADSFASVDILSSTFSGNAGPHGISLANSGAVVLNQVTANSNTGGGSGLVLNVAASLSDTDGIYSSNDFHGIQLLGITGNVTLVRTIANNNDANDTGEGDGVFANSIGGNLLIQGGRFSDTGGAGDHQERGVAVDSIVGSVTMESSGAIDMVVTGNEQHGVVIADGGTTATFNDGVYNDNGSSGTGDGIRLVSFSGAVVMNDGPDGGSVGVTTNGNDPGVFVNGAASYSNTGGVHNLNDNHGIQLLNITGAVTLTNVTAQENDADEDGTGDGVNMDEVGGPVVILGGTYSDPDVDADDQQNGIVFTDSVGLTTARVYIGNDGTTVNPVTASGNVDDGIDLDDVLMASLDTVTANNNGNFGFEISNASNVVLTDLTLAGNTTAGGDINTAASVYYTTNKAATGAVNDTLNIGVSTIQRTVPAQQTINYAVVNNLFVFTGLGTDTINVNGTGAILNFEANGGSGNDTITVAGSNLSATAAHSILGDNVNDAVVGNTTGTINFGLVPVANQGNDEFILNVAANITATSLRFFGNGNAPAGTANSANRDRLTINNAGPVTALTFDWSFGGNFETRVSGFAIPVDVLTTETIQYEDTAGNNSAVTIVGQSVGDDEITVAPVSPNSAVAFLGGDPFEDTSELPFGANLPGFAGGGVEADFSFDGLSPAGIRVNGNGSTGPIGDQLFVYGETENGLIDPVASAAAYTIFNNLAGYGAGELLDAVGAGNAFDNIVVAPGVVTVNNFVPVLFADTDFVQDDPLLTSGLIVNSGDEPTFDPLGVPDPECDGLRADQITVALSAVIPITVNGGLPPSNGVNERGDKLVIDDIFAEINVWSDKSTPPTVTFEFIPIGGGTLQPLRQSSIECMGTLFATTVNLIGDNNDPAVDQTDNFVVVGQDTDFAIGGDAAGTNEFTLEINGSIPFEFSGVEFLNAFGFDQRPVGGLDDDPATPGTADDIDTLELTAYADNADNVFPGGHPPRGWGIDVFFNEGVPAQGDGAQQDLIIYHTSLGLGGGGSVSEDVVIQPSGPDNGEIRATNQVDGSVIVVVQYVANTDIIVLDDDGSLSDSDSLTLRGTNPNTPQTSGNDRFTANFIAAGDVANPMVIVEDPTNVTPILYRLRTFSGFSTINLAGLAGNDDFILRNRAGLTVNIDGGDGVGSSSDGIIAIVPTDAFYNIGADQTSAQLIAPGVGQTNLRNLENETIRSETAGSDLIINALHGPDAMQVTALGGGAIPAVLVNALHRVAFNDLNANFDHLFLQAAGGDDTIEITTPLAGVAIDAVGGSGIDRVNVFTPIGPDTATFTPINFQTATLAIAGFGTILLSNVETATYDGSPAANDSLTLAGTSVDDLTVVNPTSGGSGSFTSNSSPAFSFVRFGALTVNGLAGTDSVEITGTEGVDTVTSDADTVFFAGAGNVTMDAAVERMILRTLAGNDSIDLDLTSATLAKTVDGGAGNDNINLAGSVDALIFGGLGDDVIVGSPAADQIFAGPGQDTINGGAGDDDIYGEDGNDTIDGDAGTDRMHGGNDFDTFVWDVGDGSDFIDGGTDGADILNFNGSAAAETFTLRPSPANATHNFVILGADTVDTHGVEQINVAGAGGSDNFIVEDLTPTEVEEVNLNVGPGGDADNVRILGRTVSDSVSITLVTAPGTTRVNVAGLAYDIEILGVVLADADTLSFESREGNDTILISDALNALFSPQEVATFAGAGDDFVSGYGILNGELGNDTLVGGAFANEINGGDGDDQIFGGGGADSLFGDAGEDTFVPGFDGLIDSIDGGADFDTILVQGTSANNRIDARQDAIGQVSYEVSGINGGDGVLGGAGTETDVIVPGTVEELEILAGSGDDLIRVSHNDSLIANGQQAFSLRFTVDGGAPGASDRLTVTDEGLGDTTIHRVGGTAGNGSFTVGALAPVVYTDIEFASLNPINPVTGGTGADGLGALFVFKHDPFEENNSRLNATFLGSNSAINVDPTVDPGVDFDPADVDFDLPGDEDWYRIVAQFNGDLDIRIFHRIQGTLANGRAGLPGNGNLDIALYDADGQPLPIAGTALFGLNDITDDERIRIPAVAGQTYYLRVRGAPDDPANPGGDVNATLPLTNANHALPNDSFAVNVYNVSVINTPAATPIDLELDDVIGVASVDAAPAPTPTSFDATAVAPFTLSTVNDFYNGKDIVFTSGNLNGIRGRILDYIGASQTFVFAAGTFFAAPGAGSQFQIESADTGRSQLDNITRDTTPTIFLRVPNVINLGGVATLDDVPFNGTAPGDPPDQFIGIPFVPTANPQVVDATGPGFRVAIFITEHGTSDQGPPNFVLAGYAAPVDVVNRPGLFSFTFSPNTLITELPVFPGTSETTSFFISARVEMIDPALPQQAQGYGDYAQSLEIVVDTQPPPVFFGLPNDADDGLLPGSDTGLNTNPETLNDLVTSDTTPGFFGQAEADAVIRLFIDAPEPGFPTGDGIFEPAIDFQIGFDVAEPFDGTNQYPNGYWQVDAVNVNLNAPPFSPIDGLRRIFVTAEDVAGNINPEVGQVIQELEIFIDTQGPQITDVTVNAPAGSIDDVYNLFDPKPSTDGPTPLVNSIFIEIRDLPNRVLPFFDQPAFKPDIAENPGHYLLTGDYNGIIPILDVNVFLDPAVNGQPATGRVELVFRTEGNDGVFNTSDDIGAALPDDRFTLFVNDEGIIDFAGNIGDFESNADEPHDSPPGPGEPDVLGVDGVPTGDGLPGGDFFARFTVDTRPELGVWAAGSAFLDINGNTIWDQDNEDFTNRDITHVLGYVSDDLFAGRFATDDGEGGLFDDGFDKLAAYGRVSTNIFRWLIDTDNDGVPDIEVAEPAGLGINGLPVAGDFALGIAGDQVGVFTGSRWHLDTDGDYSVVDAGGSVIINWAFAGHGIVGDFDGDGLDDLASWSDDTFRFDLSSIGGGGPLAGNPGINGVIDRTFRFGFAGPGERPVAADMNQDGIEDVGLWMPARDGITPRGQAEWYFLISGVTQNDTPGGPVGNIGPTIPGTADLTPGSYLAVGDPAEDYGVASYFNGRIVVDPQFPGTNIVRFQPVPFGNDQYMQFGDEFALPLVGNFDPPVASDAPINPAVNPRNPHDVNNDGRVNQIDLLAVVNYLTVNGIGPAPSGGFVSAPFVDVNDDLFCNSTDLLVLLNYLTLNPPLGQGGAGEGEAEGEGGSSSDAFFARLGSRGGIGDDDDGLYDLLARG